MENISIEITIGVIVTIFGGYLFFKLQNHIQKSEVKKQNYQNIKNLFKSYYSIMMEMKEDICNPQFHDVREFFVIEKIAILTFNKPVFRYDYTEKFLPLLNRLEEFKYITSVSNEFLHYKMSENFVELMKNFKI
ncbi:hypothetical protein GH742_03295 [Legionella sp. MW5194]|uniref:hypothetical protein n=1 Tax=Legionella sp. MW5194 TaxID=2662448 RepID=UPI00193E16CC|nr:hypothetical protein [Legionella sp. MW5194]QRN02967.1 hypothetical protein GH742_03295 [Legionella sp. MW5194]